MSDDNELSCYEYVVHFPGGQNEMRLPGLGQATILFVLPKLLMGTEGENLCGFVAPCGIPECLRNIDDSIRTVFPEKFGPPALWDDEPKWFDSTAGWEATMQVALALGRPEAGQSIPPAVLDMMQAEINDLMILLLSAQMHGIPFYLSLEVCEKPPAAVRAWWQSELRDTNEMLRKCLEEHEKNLKP